jgi:hypothetical protein
VPEVYRRGNFARKMPASGPPPRSAPRDSGIVWIAPRTAGGHNR